MPLLSGDIEMAELKIKIPDELEKSMKEFKLDWSGVAKRALIEKAEKLKKLRAFSSKFRLSDKDVKELADKVNKSVADKFFKEAE